MRALLIVPEGDSAAFARALTSGADAVLADAAAAAAWNGAGPALYLRLDALDDSGALDDLKVAAALRPAGFVLTHATGGADVQRLGARLAVEEARLGMAEGALRILAFATQTPEAVLGLASYRGASARLAGLVVTQAALAAALRAGRDSGPVRLARDLAVIAARAAGVPVFDATGAEFAVARAQGFDGAAASSEQIALIRRAFAP